MKQKLHWIRLLSWSLAMVFLLPALAWADHCGGPDDCWDTAKAAAAAAAGAAAVAAIYGFGHAHQPHHPSPDTPAPQAGDEPIDDHCTR